MKRLIAFALALAVVFGVSFALYKPERIEAAAQETMDDEWVGYFFALEPFDGRRYATENGDDYDFGVPGVPMFVTITDILPGEPGYVENDDFNHVIGAAVGDEAVGSGMNVKVDDNGSSYETNGEIFYASGEWKPVKQCSVYRTSDGKYYAEWDHTGIGAHVGVSREESVEWKVNGRTERRSIKVSVTFEERTAEEIKVRDHLIERIEKEIPYAKLNGDRVKRLPNNVNFSFQFVEGESMLILLDSKGICASSGSACTSGSLDPSHVLLAIGLPHEIAHGSLRLTISDQITMEDADYVVDNLKEIVNHLREMSPLYEDFIKKNK